MILVMIWNVSIQFSVVPRIPQYLSLLIKLMWLNVANAFRLRNTPIQVLLFNIEIKTQFVNSICKGKVSRVLRTKSILFITQYITVALQEQYHLSNNALCVRCKLVSMCPHFSVGCISAIQTIFVLILFYFFIFIFF